MKVLTLNIHSHSRIHDKQAYRDMIYLFSEWTVREGIDVIALQECCQSTSYEVVEEKELLDYYPSDGKCVIRKDNCAWLIVKELEKKGIRYYWTFCSAKLGYGKYDEGLAILSRFPILKTEEAYISGIRDYTNWKTRKIIGCKVFTGKREEWYYSVHMGWWDDEEESFIPQMDTVQALIGNRKEQVYLMGDFNSPAQVRLEGYDYVKDHGWLDTYELAAQKDAGITVPGIIDGWENGSESGMRIDFIWTNHLERINSSTVKFSGKEEPVVSDHFGVCIEK